MKRKNVKRITAAALALTMLVTELPVKFDLGGLFDNFLVTASAAAAPEGINLIKYVQRDEQGNSRTILTLNPKIIDSDTTKLTSGFYLVDSDVTVKKRIKVEKGETACIILKDGVTLTCNNGISVNAGSGLKIYGQENDTGKLVVTGAGWYQAGIGGDNSTYNGDIDIYGGTLDVTADDYGAAIGSGDEADDNDWGEIRIYGGNITAKGKECGAGIGGGNESRGCPTKIYGGTIYAQSGYYGAAIGGGDEASTHGIYIYGGEVHADSGYEGAGIGAANSDDSIYVRISGGAVYANDSSARSISRAGAGIGGGLTSNALCFIEISGGRVVAKGGSRGGAAIGSAAGNYDMEGYIDIKGGEVSVYADSGAGIGSGNIGDVNGEITISGGNVYSYSKHGAAIGSGCFGNMKGKVEISGGDLDLNSSRYGAVIGAGMEYYLSHVGGECVGEVNITGGNIKLSFPYFTDEVKKTAFIGHGYDGSKDGTLTLSDKMAVYLSDNSKDPVLVADRVNACRANTDVRESIYIKECQHNGSFNYILDNEAKHTRICKHCKVFAVSENHTLGNCPCGYSSDKPTLTYQFGDTKKYIKAAVGEEVTLPEMDEIFPDYVSTIGGSRVIKKWISEDKEYKPGDTFTVTANTEFIADYETKFRIGVDENIEGGIIWASEDTAFGYDVISIDYEPKEGYTLENISYNNIEIKPNEQGEYSFIMPYGEVTLSAVFSKDAEQKIYIDENLTGGTVTANAEKAKQGDIVKLTVTPETGSRISEVRYRTAGGSRETVVIEPKDGVYSFAMPNDAVIVSADFEYHPVSYIDENGEIQVSTDYMTLSESDSVSGDTNLVQYTGGVYAVFKNTKISSDFRPWFRGDTVFILCDGATLNITTLLVDGSLTVYKQENGTGTLNVDTISANPGKSVSLYGGNVNVNYSVLFANTSNGTINLGWTSESDKITVKDYKGNVVFAKQFVTDENGTIANKNNIGAKTLIPATGNTVTFMNGEEEYAVRGVPAETKLVARPDDPKSNNLTFIGWFTDKDGTEVYDFDSIVTKDTTLYAGFADILSGDVNFDKTVDDADAAFVLKYISIGKEFYPEDAEINAKAKNAANVNNDDEINMLDVIWILNNTSKNDNQ